MFAINGSAPVSNDHVVAPIRALFLGSKQLGLSIFECLATSTPETIWTILHPDDHGETRSSVNEFRTLAERLGADFTLVSSQKQSRDLLLSIQPDVVVVCGWYWLISEEELSVPRLGSWGIHNSLLPRYRGGSPLVWAIINGEKIVGSTVFRLTKGTDDGPVLFQVQLPLDERVGIGEALTHLNNLIVEELPNKWSLILDGHVVTQSQNHENATYCGQRIEDDGRIDWTRNSREVHNFIRAQTHPYPCAFSTLNGQKIRIRSAVLVGDVYLSTPGQVLKRSSQGVIVGCGEATAISIQEVEFEGKVIPAARAIKSNSDRLR
jgi:methionyl-tRNA formyltransferase